MESNRKTTNTQLAQFDVMVDFMEQHPHLAKGHLKTANAKASANNLWKRLMEDLNSCGQPTRDVTGWKKVWADYKNHLKAKMRKNKLSISETGGGPSRYQHTTPLEERVIQLMSIDEAVNGSSSSERFGAGGFAANHNMSVDENTENIQSNPVTDESFVLSTTKPRHQSASPRRQSATNVVGRDQLLKKQVDNQILYQENSVHKLTAIHHTLKDINRNLRKAREIEEKKYELLEERFEHNKKMSVENLKIKCAKLDIKKEMLLINRV